MSLINPEIERVLLDQLGPAISDSYETHMTSGPRNSVGDSAEDLTKGTLAPLGLLYEAANLPYQNRITPELVEHVRTSHLEHIKKFIEQGVDLAPAIHLSGLMNLGTEENLVWYHGEQFAQFKNSKPYVTMLSRWTAEEADHGPAIQLYGDMSGSISPDNAHAIKVNQIMSGISVPIDSIVSTNAYTDPQEGDTVDAHNNLAAISDPIGAAVMRKLAGHEARHMRMFRRIGEDMYKLDQELVDYALPIEAAAHKRFMMPGEKGIPHYLDMALKIAVHGLFTLEGALRRQSDRVDKLGLLSIDAKTDEAKKAQDIIRKALDPESRVNKLRQRKVESAREEYNATEKAIGRIPVILGQTVLLEKGQLQVIPNAA